MGLVSVFKLDRSIKVTTDLDGSIGQCGPGGASHSVGAWLLHFVPDASFSGTLAILGRSQEQDAATNNAPFSGPIPYRSLFLNNAPAVVPYGLDTALITGTTMIQVPANLNIGVQFQCSAGFGWLYLTDLQGSPAV